MSNSKVYLVGAGPGDVDLITKKGLDVLKKCDVVIYDRLVNVKLLENVKDECKKIYVGKVVGDHAINQDEINNIIVNEANENKIVVRLKGGDPFVFGRGGEEVIALKSKNISYEVISGVTSAISGLASAGIPVTHRGSSQSFHVITGFSATNCINDNSSLNNLDVLAKLNGTLVFLMGVSNLEIIASGLIENGKSEDTPVAIISNATTYFQTEVRGTLKTIVEIARNEEIKPPSLIVIGQVASLDLRDNTGVFSGIRIGITGTAELLKKQRELFEFLGAKVIDLCTYSVLDTDTNCVLDKKLNNINEYSWIVFTSANSVRLFFEKIKKLTVDLRAFGNIKFAVVGNGTNDVLKDYGFYADYMPTEFSSKELALGLVKIINKNDNILIPRAKNTTSEMTDIFSENQIKYDEVIIYDIISIQSDYVDNLDYITFSSSKSVIEYFNAFEKMPDFTKTKVVCIGKLTKIELNKLDIDAIITDTSDVNGLINKVSEIERKL